MPTAASIAAPVTWFRRIPVAAVAVVDGQAVPLPEVGIDLGR